MIVQFHFFLCFLKEDDKYRLAVVAMLGPATSLPGVFIVLNNKII